MKIKGNNFIRDRKSIEVHTKYKADEHSNVINHKKEIDYKYYICDYCHNEIKIEEKWENRKRRSSNTSCKCNRWIPIKSRIV